MSGTSFQSKAARSTPKGSPIAASEADTNAIIRDELMNIFLAGVDARVGQQINDRVEAAAYEMLQLLESYKEEIKRYKHLTVEVNGKAKEVKGLTHKALPQLLKIASLGVPLMVVGGAGSGKTYAAEQVAEAFNLSFHAISVGSQTSKSDLLGYNTAVGEYVPTEFRKAYENGGVFLMDEIDAGNPNVLIVLNSALSGNFCAFPNGMVRRHKDFIFLATANTYGIGASRQYVGRNQIDAATLDRFVIMDWPIDEILEIEMVKDYTYGQRWHQVVVAVRNVVEERQFRIIVSPRATQKGAKLLEVGINFQDVLEKVLLPTATADQRAPIIAKAIEVWKP